MDTTTQHAKLLIRTQVYFHDLEDCYREGYLQGYHCADETINPYKTNSLESQYWSDGWWDGCYQKKPLFELDSSVLPQASSESQHHALAWIKNKNHWKWATGIAAAVVGIGVAAVLITELAA